jgi:hypothetical protein
MTGIGCATELVDCVGQPAEESGGRASSREDASVDAPSIEDPSREPPEDESLEEASEPDRPAEPSLDDDGGGGNRTDDDPEAGPASSLATFRAFEAPQPVTASTARSRIAASSRGFCAGTRGT